VSLLRRLGTRGPSRTRGYVVCATPRCGSNFLCQLLASTGVLGDPREYFNPTGRRHYDGDPGYPDDPRAQLGRVLTTGRTGNGVYGVKIHPFQLGELGDVDPLAELPRLHVVRMQREDRLGQALSWARAQRTGRFRSSDPVAEPVAYDRDAVTAALEFLVDQEAEWDRRLAVGGVCGLPTLTVTYEELVADPPATVARVARLVGVRGRVDVDPAQVTVAVQRDAETEDWRRRYLAG